ncbi:MAG: LysM peptidoglycan-binding domain-containing M23 family metallopeptidase [Thermodesulfobacteriota bacterium]
MRRHLHWLPYLLLPLLAACSSTAGLMKKGTDPARASWDTPARTPQKNPHRFSDEEGAFHIVGKGETLHRICEVYGLKLEKVAQVNRLQAPYKIEDGDTLFLPASALLGEEDLAGHCNEPTLNCPGQDRGRVTFASAIRGKRHPSVPRLSFPVPGGELTSPFGYRWGKFHKGLDIAAPIGSSIRACADGRVMFTGSRKRFRRYGNTVLIHHGDGAYTYYAHLDTILVKKNQKVRRGQKIGTVGNTGRSTGPHLHLEVRVDNQLFNPLAYFSTNELAGVRVAKRFAESPMGPVRARWGIPDLLTANR